VKPRQTEASKARHIAFVVNNYLPKTGGVELHVASLAHTLVKEGLRVTVITLDNTGGETVEGGVRVIRLPCTPLIGHVLAFPFPGAGKRLRQRLRDLEVDAVSVHTRFFPMTYLGARAAKKLGVPAILTEHGSDHVRGVKWAVGAASKLVDFTMGRYVLKNSARVLAISEAAESFVWKLAHVRSQVFRNAIDVGMFSQFSPPTIDRPKLVFLGRLVPGKGWELALEVAKELYLEGLDFDLHFIGDGPDHGTLAQACKEARLGESVKIHGRLNLDEIAVLLHGSVLLNPTVLAEGFQTTLLEAIASRAAVVSTPVAAAQYLQKLGAPIEIVEFGDLSGWVQKTRDYLLGETPRVGAELLQQFDWSVRGREYNSILDECLPAGRRESVRNSQP
jgi:glycosyltransferase involved in cell wall biosynthesis